MPNLDERVADRFAGLGVEDADVEEDVDTSEGCAVSDVDSSYEKDDLLLRLADILAHVLVVDVVRAFRHLRRRHADRLRSCQPSVQCLRAQAQR